MGLPFDKMLAATNINDVVPRYLETGFYDPKKAFSTISNAMDVGSPSNFQRLLDLYDSDVSKMSKDVLGFTFTDKLTRRALKDLQNKYHYTADPHGAVGFLACEEYLKENHEAILVNLETAHPSKFLDVMQDVGIQVDIPHRLAVLESMEKKSISIDTSFESFKSVLLSSSLERS
jgi:threonine synthase